MRWNYLLLRPLFALLYHQAACTYDFVAAIVSLGRWQVWVGSALPYLEGHVLELGFGPGHLQFSLSKNGLNSFGLDESRQMAHQASHRLRRAGLNPCLVRGYAQTIPFAQEVFDTVVATFPSDYIYNPQTLNEIARVLAPTGRLIILPMAWTTGTRPLERLAAWVFRVSGEAPGNPRQISKALINRFTQNGFNVYSETVSMQGSQVLVIVATKKTV